MASNPEKDLADSLERIRSDIAALGQTVGQLASDTAGIQATLKKRVSSAAKQAAAMGEEMLDEATDMGTEAMHAAARTATSMVDSAETQIARNPLTSVLVALGLGLALGIISRR